MSVTPRDLLTYATSLGSGDELTIRAAVNRGYYAVFHAARTFHDSLASPGMMPSQSFGIHETLYHQLTHPTIPTTDPLRTLSRQIAYKSKDLKRLRELADYRLADPITSKDLQYVIDAADTTLKLASM